MPGESHDIDQNQIISSPYSADPDRVDESLSFFVVSLWIIKPGEAGEGRGGIGLWYATGRASMLTTATETTAIEANCWRTGQEVLAGGTLVEVRASCSNSELTRT
jgi:hypothetical protein